MAERKNTSPSAEPRKATAQTTSTSTPGDPTELDRLEEIRTAKVRERVEASDLEAAPEDQKGPTGGSFYNPAHVGSGTILPDGTYGAPLPDPNVERLAKAHEEAKDRDTQ